MSVVIDPTSALILEVKSPKSGRTVLFIKLKDLYKECMFLIQDLDQLYPLFCLKNDHCPRNMNCMNTLANRVKYVFDKFPAADLLLLYFTYRDNPTSHRAGVFWKDMREPRYITFNRSQWEYMKEVGTVYQYKFPDDLFLGKL